MFYNDSFPAICDFFFGISRASHSAGSSVVVEITDLKNQNGQVLISIYNQPGTFPSSDDRLLQKIISNIRGERVRIEFDNLKNGTYAIAAMHDENSDGKMNYYLVRYPKEGFCFSNNVKPKFRKPRWTESKFVLDKEVKKISIKMRY